MKRIHAAVAAAPLAFAVAALLSIRPGDAASQTGTGHEHHGSEPATTGAAAKAPAASAAAGTAAPGKSAATQPTKTADGKYTLPGVPPGRFAMGGGVTTVITGEVMDPACFLEAGDKSVGRGHFQCAVDCARSGQTLAIYDREIDRIYFVAGELPGRNPNDPIFKYIHQKVDVTGTVYNRSQAWGIVIVKVEPHKPKGAAVPTAKR